MTRVPTHVSGQILLNRIVDLQGAHFDSTLQVNSRQKSQTYAGLSIESFRLISLETIRERADRFNSGNILAEVRAKQTQASANDIERTAQDIIANIREGAKFRTDVPSSEYIASLRQMRKNVVGALAQIRDTLNVDLEGRFIFAGGREQTPPVNMPVSNFTEFEETYDGNNVTFPETRAGNLFNVDFRGVDITFGSASVPHTSGPLNGQTINHGTFEAPPPEPFITGTIAAATAGNMDFFSSVLDPRPGVSEGKIVSSNANAFSRLERGMALMIDSGTAANDGIYTVTEVSADGREVKVTPPFPTAPSVSESIDIKIGVPQGATIEIENSTGNNDIYTVNYPPNADIPAGDLPNILNGTLIYTTPPPPTTGTQSGISIISTGYYRGDTLENQHRVDEIRVIQIGLNAQNAAFEKLIRGLGIIGQGFPLDATGEIDLPEFYRRIDLGIELVNDAILHSTSVNESAEDLPSVQQTIGFGRADLHKAQDRTRNFIAFLDTTVAKIEEVDMAEAITRLNEAQRTLEASYEVTARLSRLSLKDFI